MEQLKQVNITNIIGDAGDNSTLDTLMVVTSSILDKWENGEPDNYYSFFGDHGFIKANDDGEKEVIQKLFIN